jgi:hypothetical protein
MRNKAAVVEALRGAGLDVGNHSVTSRRCPS